MQIGILSYYTSDTKPATILEYLNCSSFDELIEVDIARDHFQVIYHVEEKYYLPITEGRYSQFFYYSVDHLLFEEDREGYAALMDPGAVLARLATGTPVGTADLHFRIRDISGEWRWVEQILVSGEENGVPAGKILCYIFDIQNVKNRESGISKIERRRNPSVDALTGLLRGQDFLNRAAEVMRGFTEPAILVRIDLEHFKMFNEWYSWENGNLVLARIGGGLQKDAVQCGGLAGYLGDDDFCLLGPEAKIDLERIYTNIHGVLIRYGASFGFLPTMGVCRIDASKSVMNNLDHAFIACKHDDRDSRFRIRYYDPSIAIQREKEYRMLSDFQQALATREITFDLQPQCRASTGQIVGAESLARWRRADGFNIPPGVFIPILEHYGFVTDLDQYIWEEVCKWVRSRLDLRKPVVPISINVSQIDIFIIDVPGVLERLLEKYLLPHDAIKVEITESACAGNSQQVRDVVQRLRDNGFMVMMDDFGSGYSSLNMLHELEVDVIKLDARFLKMEQKHERKGIHILESVINMTKIMELPVIVEGVESEAQKDFLSSLGCRYIQGYYFYRPMKPEQFETLLDQDGILDREGFRFKSNEQFRVREFLDETIYSDSMLNNILGPVALYAWSEGRVDIVRFNEQFYEAVNVQDFHNRLDDIARFMPPADFDKMENALTRAMTDQLNGASEVMTFFRTDGGAARFLIHFYYLGEDGGVRRFYGSARNVTDFTNLQHHMKLLSHFFSECIIFLMPREGRYLFEVAAYGLEAETGLTKAQMEEELLSGAFYRRIVPEQVSALHDKCMAAVNGQNFQSYFTMINTEGKPVTLHIRSDYVSADVSDVRCILVISKKQQVL